MATTDRNTQDLNSVKRCWQFADAVLDEGQFELRVNGEVAELERRSLDVLIYLLTHAGEVVTKDELLDAVWHGRVVSESVLSKCMSRIRAALDDSQQAIIKTVHGVGYRIICEVNLQTSDRVIPEQGLELAEGDAVPLRPNWQLRKLLGKGRYGEAWLGEQIKTREQRVFKFASSAEALPSLKREITLSRVLHDSLGERPDLLPIRDWNLGEAPYYLECDYIKGGNLVDWIESQGGLASLSKVTRLQLLIQIAEGLAAAHSVGVLHKDLKPSNILVREIDGKPMPMLSDFGCGGVLDFSRLDALAITRMGMTLDLRGESTTGGTPLYAAPEVLSGQPFTVRSDIYALGVILYQLLAGNLEHPLAQGWEADVDDELLREDIAKAVDGHVERRLSDASQLAQRLRNLDQRRQARHDAELKAERAKRAQQALIDIRRWRTAAIAILIFAGVATLAGINAYHSRNAALAAAGKAKQAEAQALVAQRQSEQARHQAEALNDFVLRDVLSLAQPGAVADRNLTIRSVLKLASSRIDGRLQQHPLAAARLRHGLGQSFRVINEVELAREQFELAQAAYVELLGADSLPAIISRAETITAMPDADRNTRFQHWQDIAQALEKQLPKTHPYAIVARTKMLVWQLVPGSEYGQLLDSLQVELRRARQAPSLPAHAMGIAGLHLQDVRELLAFELNTLAHVYWRGSRFQKMSETLGEAIELRESYADSGNYEVAQWRQRRALALAEWGQFEEALLENERASEALSRILGPEHQALSSQVLIDGVIAAWQGRTDDALREFNDLISRCGEEACTKATPFALAFARVLRDEITLTYSSQEDYAAGPLETLKFIETYYKDPAARLHSRLNLSLAQALNGHSLKAWKTLHSIDRNVLQSLPDESYLLAAYERVQGLIWAQEKHFEKSLEALSNALRYQQRWRQADHWLVTRLEGEIAEVKRAGL